MNLQELKVAILEDNVVDAAEVAQLRELIMEDGVIDREEADVLFEINDAVNGNDNHESWGELFAEAISSHVLNDDQSNGEIDEEEADYLISKVMNDGTVDAVERKMLETIKEGATSVHEKLEKAFDQYNI